MNVTFCAGVDNPSPRCDAEANLHDTIPLVQDEDESLELQSPPNFVTTRSRLNREVISKSEFQEFQDKVFMMLSKQDENMARMLKEFGDFKTSVQFMSDSYDTLLKEISAVKSEVKAVETRMLKLEQSEELIVELQAKIDSMEQRARQCNIEIGNLPEKREEKLCEIVKLIGDAIEHPISLNEIVSAHRVPHADPKSKLPKNVVVKLYSRLSDWPKARPPRS